MHDASKSGRSELSEAIIAGREPAAIEITSVSANARLVARNVFGPGTNARIIASVASVRSTEGCDERSAR